MTQSMEHPRIHFTASISPVTAIIVVVALAFGGVMWMMLGFQAAKISETRQAEKQPEPRRLENDTQLLSDIRNRLNEIKAGIQDLKRRLPEDGMGCG